MPTLRKNKGNKWMARVVVDGKQVACRMFPPGKKYGPEWREAKEWEEAERKKFRTIRNYNPQNEKELQQKEEQRLRDLQTHMALEKLFAWGNHYLQHAHRSVSQKTYREKQVVMKDFFAFCSAQEIYSLEDVSAGKCYTFLSSINDTRGANVANMYRRNMLAAWKWGMDFIDDFPQIRPPFQRVKVFPVVKRDKYVPPEEDLIKVLHMAEGQDFVLLLFLYYTGARKGEAFRLMWKDVDLEKATIRLRDQKTGNGQGRVRWLSLHPELVKALLWWRDFRPCVVDNVFMQIQSYECMGAPYVKRTNFMKRLCDRAEVKCFGFHAIRHKAAAIAFTELGLNAAQTLMGHSRASTTDIYTKSAGLYADQGTILSALGNSNIGQAVGGLLTAKIIHE